MPPPRGAIYDFDVVRFGGPTDVREVDVSVNTTPIELLPDNPDRVEVIIQNQGGNTITWSLQGTVTTTTGTNLAAGQMIVFQVQNDGALCGRRLWAIAAAGPNAVHITYVYRIRPEG